MKIQITEKQAQQFNRMLDTLKKISKDYMTTEQLRSKSEKMYGLEFEECIEMVYDNIQSDAQSACKNVKRMIIQQPNSSMVEDVEKAVSDGTLM